MFGHISWAAIDRYARRHGIVGDEFERLHELIRAMDGEWLKVHAERAKAAAQKPPR